jgi:hypothetical protein
MHTYLQPPSIQLPFAAVQPDRERAPVVPRWAEEKEAEGALWVNREMEQAPWVQYAQAEYDRVWEEARASPEFETHYLTLEARTTFVVIKGNAKHNYEPTKRPNPNKSGQMERKDKVQRC